MNSVGSQTTQKRLNGKELAGVEQKQLLQISQIQKRTQQMRAQLKSMSESASKIIEKKLSASTNTTTKPRPNLRPSYQSKKLQQIKDQKQKIYREIAQTKELIDSLKQQGEPQVKNEILKRQVQLREIIKVYEKAVEEKRYVVEEMQTNKEKIAGIKESGFNKDLTQNQRLLDQMRKQKAHIQKKIYQLTTQQIQQSMYYFELKSKLQLMTQSPQKQERHDKKVPVQEIKQLIEEINMIIVKRNDIEKEKEREIVELYLQVKQLQKENSKMTNSYRHVEGQIMRRNLQNRFYQSQIQKLSSSKSTQNLTKNNNQYSSFNIDKNNPSSTIQPPQKQKLTNPNKLNRTPSLINPTKLKKQNQNIIEIGSVSLDQSSKLLKDPILNENQDVDKLHSIVFFLTDNRIVGVRQSFLSKSLVKIHGQVLAVDRLEKYVEKEVNVKEIKEIEYPINSKNLCLKIHKFNGSIDVIGTQYYGATTKATTSNRPLKDIHLIIEKNKQGAYQKVKGLLFNLQTKSNKQQRYQTEGQKGEDGRSEKEETFITSSPSHLHRKAQSIDVISMYKDSSSSNSYKKKVVLKPIKKDVEQTLDHRLLIRKKLV